VFDKNLEGWNGLMEGKTRWDVKRRNRVENIVASIATRIESRKRSLKWGNVFLLYWGFSDFGIRSSYKTIEEIQC